MFLWHLAICLRVAFADGSAGVEGPPEYDEAIDDGNYGTYPTRAYATVDDITSPQTNYLEWGASMLPSGPWLNSGSLMLPNATTLTPALLHYQNAM